MNSEEKTAIGQDARERLKSLKEYSARRREWYQDVNLRIADKQSEHLISISSISAAIIALTVAFQIQRNLWIELSFWALMATVILGTLLALLLIIYNKKGTNYTRIIELSTINNLKKSTENVIQNPNLYANHRQDFAQEIRKIEELPDKYKSERNILEYLYFLTLIAFTLGILGLVFAWITKDIVTSEVARNSNMDPNYANIEERSYMDNLIIVGVIFLVSLILGFIKFGSTAPSRKDWSWQLNFIEFWNCTANFLIAGLAGYYFVLVRWPILLNGGTLSNSDFVLFTIFAMGLFGHLNVLSHNITKGVEAILDRVLKR